MYLLLLDLYRYLLLLEILLEWKSNERFFCFHYYAISVAKLKKKPPQFLSREH